MGNLGGTFLCCKDCVPPQREPGCHGKCEDYIRDKAKREELNEKIKKERNKDKELNSFLSKMSQRDSWR